jgi:hypothetical protein
MPGAEVLTKETELVRQLLAALRAQAEEVQSGIRR